ncbi:HAMP domain-containing sensor histidine kinase [Clostridium sp. DL1XJH146]
MNIKKRLTYSHIAMVIVPMILISLIIYLFRMVYISNYNTNYSGRYNGVVVHDIYNTLEVVNHKTNLKLISIDTDLSNQEFVGELEEELTKINGGVVIFKGNENVYSTEFLKKDEYKTIIEDYSHVILLENSEWGSSELMNLVSYDFYFRDSSKGTICILMDTTYFMSSVNKIMLSVIIIAISILILTQVVLTYFVSKSIVTPLNKLKDASEEIKNGNLDFEIGIKCKKSNNEITELSNSFEEMRIKLKESLSAQKQYEENRKELISNISHDLRTPITSIKGYIQGIKDGIADSPEKMDKYIDTIIAKADHMDNLINDLFLFSKLDLKKVDFNLCKLDFTDYLEDCTEELGFDLLKKNIQFVYTKPKGKIFVYADGQQIKRVITNIVSNSVKNVDLDKSPLIELSVEDKEEYIIVKIKDNGRGISKEALPYIFERFYREDTSRNINTGASGLGLAISKGIVEYHTGEIWAESQQNIGTEILFTLKKYDTNVNIG